MSNKIDVLDHGYVTLRQSMGTDHTVTSAARVSYDKRSEPNADGGLEPRDKKLLAYLISNGHTSPLRHSVLTFEVYAPLMVMRQWGKYRVGSVWGYEDSDDPIETVNESSRRYVTEEPVFYIPDVWRSAPENSKQGSGGALPSDRGQLNTQHMRDMVEEGVFQYEDALANGVAAEQARLFLPAYALYVRAWWTVSLQGVVHFLTQRLDSHAQWEIREFAQAVHDLTQPLFPYTFELLELGKDRDE